MTIEHRGALRRTEDRMTTTLTCCHIDCDRPATRRLSRPESPTAQYDESYACDEHVDELRAEGETDEPWPTRTA